MPCYRRNSAIGIPTSVGREIARICAMPPSLDSSFRFAIKCHWTVLDFISGSVDDT